MKEVIVLYAHSVSTCSAQKNRVWPERGTNQACCPWVLPTAGEATSEDHGLREQVPCSPDEITSGGVLIVLSCSGQSNQDYHVTFTRKNHFI